MLSWQSITHLIGRVKVKVNNIQTFAFVLTPPSEKFLIMIISVWCSAWNVEEITGEGDEKIQKRKRRLRLRFFLT